ncbi:MAG: lipopolysaccharide biosynthesis protein [Marinilabiliaceae bacterium]|nr:lipopolysaccharide biosynthesis protein [Marinilabiliaceae bacterium]
MSEENLKQKTAKGLAWTSIGTISNRLITFCTGIVLARILSPSDYGITALITVFVVVLGIFTDGGLSTALIRKENRTESDIATVFWYNLVACCIAYLLIFSFAPYLADFYEIPILCDIARVSTLSLLISPFSSIQSTMLSIRMDFKTSALIGITCNLIAGIIAIIMAYNGFGVWSLAYQGLIGTFCSAILMNIALRWRPKFKFSKESFRELFGFSSKMIVSLLIWRVYENVSSLIIGKCYSTHQLGVYNRALGWAQLPSTTFVQTIHSVSFPALSKLQNDIQRLRSAYRKMIRLTAFISFPMLLGLASVAAPLTIFVLTEKWAESIPLLQILCFSFILHPINTINESLLLCLGRSDIYLRYGIYTIGINVICMCITIPFGLNIFCFGILIGTIAGFLIKVPVTNRLIALGFKDQISDILPIFINCCIMYFLCTLSQMFFIDNIHKLIMAISVGAIYYIATGLLFFKEDANEVLSILHLKRGNSR